MTWSCSRQRCWQLIPSGASTAKEDKAPTRRLVYCPPATIGFETNKPCNEIRGIGTPITSANGAKKAPQLNFFIGLKQGLI